MSDQGPPLRAAVIPVTPFEQNCTLLWCQATRKAAVIDPGGDVARILDVVKQFEADDKAKITVDRIWLTHGHIDHAGGAAELKEALGGVAIEGPHEADKFLLENLKKQGQAYGIEARNVLPDRWLAENDMVTLGELKFRILFCPGHSPGSVVFVFEEPGPGGKPVARYAQMGDVLFKGSIGRTDLPYCDHDALISAIKTKIFPLGDDVPFIPGHGEPSTIGEERRSNPFVGEGT